MMIQRYFNRIKHPKTMRFSKAQFVVGAQALHDPAVELLFDPEPVKDQFLVLPRSAGNLFEWFDMEVRIKKRLNRWAKKVTGE